MRKVLIVALLMLPSACAYRADPSVIQPVQGIPGAMNAPLVLEVQPVQPVVAPAPRFVPKSRTRSAKGTTEKWGARIDYDDRIDRPDLLAGATRNHEISRPIFATLKRSFGEGDFQPYIGVGIGQASSRFDAVDPGEQDGLAVKGVVGGNLTFTDAVGGYVQYDYAIASENPALADNDKSHGISFGINISLN